MKTHTRTKRRVYKIDGGNDVIHLTPSHSETAVSWSEFTVESSTLRYEVTKDQVFKNCRHNRYYLSPGVYGHWVGVRNAGEPLEETCRLPNRYLLWYLLENSVGVPIVQTAVRAFRAVEGGNKMEWFGKLRFVSNDPAFNLPVFLIELAELKTLWKSVKTHALRIKKIVSRNQGNRLANLGDLFAGGWLEWSFGFGAFVRDLLKLVKLFSSFKDDHLKFISGMGVPQKARVVIDLNPLLPKPEETIVSIGGWNWRVRTRFAIGRSYAHEPYGCLSASYRYWSAAMSAPWGKTKFFLQRFGVVWNPAIVWELIPLSFLLDWVIPVGKWLENKRIDAVDLNITIDGCGFGNRLSVIKVYEVMPEGSQTWEFSGEEQVHLYGRTRVAPSDAPEVLQFGKYSLRKAITGSALAWTILLRKKS